MSFMNRYRLLFSATGSPAPIITKEIVKEVDFDRYWFDIAVPRDIEDVEMKNLHIFAVDDLQEIVTQKSSPKRGRGKNGLFDGKKEYNRVSQVGTDSKRRSNSLRGASEEKGKRVLL